MAYKSYCLTGMLELQTPLVMANSETEGFTDSKQTQQKI